MTQSQKIIPCLWFDSNAEEAAAFYASLFADSHIGKTLLHSEEGRKMNGKPPGSVMTVDFTLAGFRFTGLNGGPLFAFTPAISFYVTCETEAEIDTLWAKLSEGGVALMPLANYDWSEKYGWVQDRFGLTWQLSLEKLADEGQKIVPFLMFGASNMATPKRRSSFIRAVSPIQPLTTFYAIAPVKGLPPPYNMRSLTWTVKSSW